jgi:hypothetical protein
MTHLFNLYRTAKLAIFAALPILAIGIANAQSPQCTALKGTYAFTASGSAVFPGNSTPVLLNAVGVLKFDAGGTFTAVVSQNFNGFVQRFAPGSGTYTLKPDCSGTITQVFLDGSVHVSDFAVSRRGKTIYAVGVGDEGPGNMIALTATRID